MLKKNSFHLFIRLILVMMMIVTGVCAKEEKEKKKAAPLPEISFGEASAPVLIIDYSSLTCHHCADFYLNVLPEIKEKYIKPGYVRLIFRDFPGDQTSLAAHQIAWCKGEMKYLDFVKLIYSTQEKWLLEKDPIAALKAIVVKHGISAEQFEAAIKNQDLLDKIIQIRLEGQKKYKITAIPTIVINTRTYQRALTMEEINDILKPLLKNTEKKDKKEAVVSIKAGRD